MLLLVFCLIFVLINLFFLFLVFFSPCEQFIAVNFINGHVAYITNEIFHIINMRFSLVRRSIFPLRITNLAVMMIEFIVNFLPHRHIAYQTWKIAQTKPMTWCQDRMILRFSSLTITTAHNIKCLNNISFDIFIMHPQQCPWI